jgi:hypothetical protein
MTSTIEICRVMGRVTPANGPDGHSTGTDRLIAPAMPEEQLDHAAMREHQMVAQRKRVDESEHPPAQRLDILPFRGGKTAEA